MVMVLVARTGPKAARLVWEFIKSNWGNIQGYVPWLGSVLQDVTLSFSTAEDLRGVEAFFQAHKDAGSEDERRLVVETIKANMRWQSTQRTPVLNWLKLRGY